MQSEGTTPLEAINKAAPAVQQYIREHFSIVADGKELPLRFTKTDLFDLEKGNYAQYFYETPRGERIPDQLTIRNKLLYENDRLHRSLIAIEYNKKTGRRFVRPNWPVSEPRGDRYGAAHPFFWAAFTLTGGAAD